MSQIEQIAEILKSNLVRLDCWDWKNDTFNEAYVADCDKVAQMLYDQGVRVIDVKEQTDRKDCPTCKRIVECNLDKQAFYKFADKQCEGWERDDKL